MTVDLIGGPWAGETITLPKGHTGMIVSGVRYFCQPQTWVSFERGRYVPDSACPWSLRWREAR